MHFILQFLKKEGNPKFLMFYFLNIIIADATLHIDMRSLRKRTFRVPHLYPKPFIPYKEQEPDHSGSGKKGKENSFGDVDPEQSYFLYFAFPLQCHELIGFLLVQLVHGLIKGLIGRKTHLIVDHP